MVVNPPVSCNVLLSTLHEKRISDLIHLSHGSSIRKCICRSKFKCAALKLAMIKNQHLADSLFKGNVYDCVCLYEPAAALVTRI